MDDLLTRNIPYSTEAEQAVIGSVLIDPKCVGDVIGVISASDFYLETNRLIFETIVDMFTKNDAIDPVTLLDELALRGYGDKIDREYFARLVDATPTAVNVMQYAEIVRGKSMLRELQSVADGILTDTRSQTESPEDIADLAEQRIYAVRNGKEIKGLTHIKDAVSSLYDQLDEIAQNGGKLPGIPTGFSELDNRIGGLKKGNLLILAARPGMGKTALALNIAKNAARKSGKTVVVFQLEMSKEEIASRMLSSQGFIDGKRLRNGDLSDDDWTKMAGANDELSAMNILIDENPNISVPEIKAKCRRVSDLGLIVIDYLQLLHAPGFKNGDNRVQEVQEISRSLKIMAKELNVPVLCCSQLSRGSENRTSKKPMLSDLRESGSIEQDADIVMFIYREDYYADKDKPPTNKAELIIAKNRHGETKPIDLQWMGQYSTFAPLETNYDETPG